MKLASAARQTAQSAVAPLPTGEMACQVSIPTTPLAFDGFREWATSPDFPDNIRAAFIIDEVFIEMSNEEIQTHVLVKGEISRVVASLCKELDIGQFFIDGLLLSNVTGAVSNNPDATFMTWETLKSGRVRLVPKQGNRGQFRELEGTPDWVLEVVSDSSVNKDVRQLRIAYHRAGIPEYWLVDARGDEVDFQILHWRKKGYTAAPVKDGWQKSRVFDHEFRLTRTKNDIELWDYTLELRPS